jgi:membrane protease subunit HflC
MRKSIIAGIIGVIVVLIIVGSTAFVVRETEQVMVLRFGEPQRVISEPGLNFKVPILDTATYFDKRVLDYDATSQEIPTADQKQLVVDAFARYKIVDPLRFFQAVGNEVGMQQRLDSIINSSLRNVLGDVELAVVLTPGTRPLDGGVHRSVARQGESFGIDVVDVRIKRIDLPSENSQAIFNRMRTQREQEATLIRAEGEKESRRIHRRGRQARARHSSPRPIAPRKSCEARATRKRKRCINSAYGQNPDFFDFWRSMQAMQRGLSGETTTYVGPPDSDFFRFFREEQGGITQ